MIIKEYPIVYNTDINNIYVELPIRAKILSANIIYLKKTESIEAYVHAIVNEKETKKIKREILWLGLDWILSKEEEKKIKKYQYLGSYKGNKNDIWHIWIEPEEKSVSNKNF